MRVAMYYRNDDVRLATLPKPQIGPDEVLVQVVASGICGSDVLEWYRMKTAPRVLGHEIAGDLAAVGAAVTGWRPGDRVAVTHHVPCNVCRYCLAGHHTACDTLHHTNFDPGGFAEFVRVPAINVDRGMLRLPEGVSYEEATFVEPLGCVVRGQRLLGVEAGQTVLVIGSGISGLLHIRLARAVARVIATDIRAYRLDAARRSGADAVIDARDDVPAGVRALNGGYPADRVIVCTGARPAIQQALRSVDRGGRVLFFAVPPPGEDVPVDLTALWRNEVTLMTSYGAAGRDLTQALDLIHTRRVAVSDLITHRLPLSDTQRGFQLVAEADQSIKVIVEPQDGCQVAGVDGKSDRLP